MHTLIYLPTMFLSGLLIACVTVHNGTTSQIAGWNTTMSCAFTRDLKGLSTQAMTCNFENTGDAWQKLEIASVTFSDGSQVATPEESQAFVKSYNLRRLQDRHNTELAAGAAMIGGLALMMVGGSNNSVNAGAAIAGGGVAASTWNNVGDSKNAAMQPEAIYGSDHMLGGEFSIPDKLYARKAMLVRLQKPGFLPSSTTICFRKPDDSCHTVSLKPQLYSGRFD